MKIPKMSEFNISILTEKSDWKRLLFEMSFNKSSIKDLKEEEKCLLGTIVGFVMHKDFCNNRKLKRKNRNGFYCKAKIKELNTEADKDFVLSVLNKEREESKTLFIKDDKVFMDIANTSFFDLSPYWHNENVMAGYTSLNILLEKWEKITSKNKKTREKAQVDCLKQIHSAWVERNGKNNKKLCVDFDFLSKEEQNKDLMLYEKTKEIINILIKNISSKL